MSQMVVDLLPANENVDVALECPAAKKAQQILASPARPKNSKVQFLINFQYFCSGPSYSCCCLMLILYYSVFVSVCMCLRGNTKNLREHQRASVPEAPARGSYLSKRQMPTTSVDLPTATCVLIQSLQPSARRALTCCCSTEF